MSSDRERKFTCTNNECQKEVVAELPEMEVINKPAYSMLMIPHQAFASCAHCGQAYGFVLKGVKQMEFGWMPVVLQKVDDGVIHIPSPSDVSKLV